MRSKLFIAVALFLVALIGGSVAVFAVDQAADDRVADGVRVGGVDLGGLSPAEARERLRTELVDPLSAPVVVRARGRRFRLSAEVARLRADLDAMVAEAVERSRGGTIFARTWRAVAGGEVDADLEPRVGFDGDALDRFVRRVARGVDRDPRDAKVAFAATGLRRVAGRDGLRVDRDVLRERVAAALLSTGDERRVRARLRRTRPKVTTRQLARRYDTVVVVDRGSYTLRLFKRLKLARSYRIAVGQVGLETPAGLYSVQNKAVDPAWNVPNSAWAGALAGRVIPGGVPENPLKARWMGIYDGAGIHGTDARGSIGTSASHGCIRMLVEDVVELYDRVPVGAPVYIA